MYNKRGISPVIGYVILITVTLAMGVLVFVWARVLILQILKNATTEFL